MADSRLLMNVKGLGSVLIPRVFFRFRLDVIFKEILSLKQEKLEKLLRRAHFYNQISRDFSRELFEGKSPPHRINLFPFKHTAYAFDAYKNSKYFDDDFVWFKNFNDVNWNFSEPTICKSRPISPQNSNNILLKLDKNRHFCFFKDNLNFSQKLNKAVFRGACFQPLRKKFLKLHQNNKNCDIKNILRRNSLLNRKGFLSKKAQCGFKFIICLEGNDVASNLKWAMNSNSLVLAPKMTCETWFMESALAPNFHFALLDDEFENLDNLIEYFLANPSQAEQIIKNAHEFCAQFFDEKMEFYAGILVLLKYFYYSNQLKNKNFSQAILNLIRI